MKGILSDVTLKQRRFVVERTCSLFEEIEEYRTGSTHYFKSSVGPYKKFLVNGQRTRGEAYRACVAFAEGNGYTLTAK